MSKALSSVQDVYKSGETFKSQGVIEGTSTMSFLLGINLFITCTSSAHLPRVKDLQLTHFSSTCVLLHWTAAASTSNLSGVVLQGYRVYVNGVPEGMVCVCVCVCVCV